MGPMSARYDRAGLLVCADEFPILPGPGLDRQPCNRGHANLQAHQLVGRVRQLDYINGICLCAFRRRNASTAKQRKYENHDSTPGARLVAITGAVSPAKTAQLSPATEMASARVATDRHLLKPITYSPLARSLFLFIETDNGTA
jgi:hypothetical protein